MSQLSKSSGQRVRTDLMVCVQTLNVTVVTLEWKTPPSMNWPEQEEAGCKMEGEMMIWNKLVFEQPPKTTKILLHMFVEKPCALGIHRSPGGKVDGDH